MSKTWSNAGCTVIPDEDSKKELIVLNLTLTLNSQVISVMTAGRKMASKYVRYMCHANSFFCEISSNTVAAIIHD